MPWATMAIPVGFYPLGLWYSAKKHSAGDSQDIKGTLALNSILPFN